MAVEYSATSSILLYALSQSIIFFLAAIFGEIDGNIRIISVKKG